ncbi:nuclear transport factor 2 family protein [Chitinophaga sp. sic0106]|uniref:nuclear transport factor 2 family protein n=1 Tax=Chitinophaga sp. sic0106 TaxID=2854785 RepID=UPI001C481DF7|nr:nuclear transport factor 2 family protein [Chitinophaga sp. sic0106]MBV7532575.1 nuclear transport factor 2 family protein [Chitinophaga sp. sic0106]
MVKPLFAAAMVISFFACTNPSQPQRDPLKESSTALPDTTLKYDVRYRDQQQIEKVIYGFAENFDNGSLEKCLEFMDDSIRGEIDGVKLRGKENFATRVVQLGESVKSAKFQQRHLISNMQFEMLPNDSVRVSMYCANVWTDIKSGEIQLMAVGYYKGKLVKKADKWLIAVLNSLPDSRLVERYYKEQEDSLLKK